MFIGRGPNELRHLCIVNYELSRQYVDDHGAVLLSRPKSPFRGSPRYASASALEELEQGRVDDLWSWFFSIIELTAGKLPWDSLVGPTVMVNTVNREVNARIF